MRAVVLVSAILVVTSSSAIAGPAGRAPKFEAAVEMVDLGLTVVDGREQYVTDLRPEDVAVFEDGVQQEVSLFSRDEMPLSVSLMIDASESMGPRLAFAQQAACRFVRTLRNDDLAEVRRFNGRAEVVQEATSDTAMLENAIQGVQVEGATALYNALYIVLKERSKLRKSEAPPRRHAIVLITDGKDTISTVRDEDVLKLARRAGVAIYAIGLPVLHELSWEMDGKQAVHFLTAASRETGGFAHFPVSLSELDALYARIARELRAQYTIGYVSSNPRQDGGWRRLAVQTPGRAGLQLRYKLGYFAARAAGLMRTAVSH
jgi:VWFA-related protein